MRQEKTRINKKLTVFRRIIFMVALLITFWNIHLGFSQNYYKNYFKDRLYISHIMPLFSKEYVKTLLLLLSNATKEINIIMYSMRYYYKYPNSPSNLLINELKYAARRGVKVEVIFERSEGLHSEENTEKNKAVARILTEAGINVYLDELYKTTHDKLILIDNKYTILGSFNWTYHALCKNNESAVLIISEKITRLYKAYFNSIKRRSKLF